MAERTAETLVALGTEVANKMIKQGSDMTQTIAGLRASLQLNDEEVRRVCENANRAAFANYYYTMGGEERNPQFALAKASDIVGDPEVKMAALEKTASYAPGFITPRTDKFSSTKLRSQLFDSMMEKGAALMQKQASTPVEKPVGVQWETARGLLGKARENMNVAEYHFKQAAEELRKEARDVLRSTPLEHLIEALLQVSMDKEASASITLAELRPVIEDMRANCMLKQAEWHQEPQDVNVNHPVVVAYTKAMKWATVMAEAQENFEKAASEERRLRQEVIRAHSR